jgi:predicted PurR-regulated permease PerM
VVSFAGNIGHAVLAIFVMEVLLYFLLTSQENFFAGVSRYWPSRPEYLTVISREISSITRSVVISTALIALIQTLIMTLAFWLIGLPQVALLAGLTFILSLLPFVGAPVVWGSIAVFQFFSGHLDTMVILTIVGLGVSTIDNFLRPYFQRKFGEMHPLTSLVGVILGVPIFGFIGLFIGPIILTLTIELTKISLLEFKSE